MTEIVAAHLERVAREWLTASNGERFYVSPDGNWLIWETRSPTAADEAHRGLAAALAACAREAKLEEAKWMSSQVVWHAAVAPQDYCKCFICQRIVALERAVGESSLDPQGGQHEN